MVHAKAASTSADKPAAVTTFAVAAAAAAEHVAVICIDVALILIVQT